MSVSHRYRNFGGSAKDSAEAEGQTSGVASEEEKLQSFEAGYQAGWDDALKAQKESNDHISAEFAQNLQDMTFTYHEALSKLTSSIEPVMKEVVSKLLPEIVAQSLVGHICEQIDILIKENVGQNIEVVVCKSNVSKLEMIAGDKYENQIKIVAEETLGEGQAFVRIGNSERQVDIAGVVEGVSNAIAAFFYQSHQEKIDG